MIFKNYQAHKATTILGIGVAIGLLLIAKIPRTVAAEPITRQGFYCPNGYSISGGYCIPKNDSKASIPKSGDLCPQGYEMQGNYCNPRNKKTTPAINRQGNSCPNGYIARSGYCVKRE